MEIEDTEFELLLERLIDLWKDGKDTIEMARILEVPEAKTAYVLSCLMDGMYECKLDEEAPPISNGER